MIDKLASDKLCVLYVKKSWKLFYSKAANRLSIWINVTEVRNLHEKEATFPKLD